MKFKEGDLVTYKNSTHWKCFRVKKVFPNFRQKNMKGYSIYIEEPGTASHGTHFASVKEESLEKFV